MNDQLNGVNGTLVDCCVTGRTDCGTHVHDGDEDAAMLMMKSHSEEAQAAAMMNSIQMVPSMEKSDVNTSVKMKLLDHCYLLHLRGR